MNSSIYEERRIALVCSRFNEEIVQRLLESALETLEDEGVNEPLVVWVPGAFELPLVATELALCEQFDAVICLGCVIRGETGHYDMVAEQSARGIMEAGLKTGIPVIYGVLTTENLDQANRRSGLLGGINLGSSFAKSALEMIAVMEKLEPELCV